MAIITQMYFSIQLKKHFYFPLLAIIVIYITLLIELLWAYRQVNNNNNKTFKYQWFNTAIYYFLLA